MKSGPNGMRPKMKQPQLKLNDKVHSNRNSSGTVFKIVRISDDGKIVDVEGLDSRGNAHVYKDYNASLFYLVGTDGIDVLIEHGREHVHEWKRITLFRTDEFCCTKCSAVRPFDKEKDAV